MSKLDALDESIGQKLNAVLSAVGSGATESMPIAGPHAALCVAFGLLVPVVSFGALDACYRADDWFFLLGIMAAKKGT